MHSVQPALRANERPVSQLNTDARATFISKTYSHLLGGIILFALAISMMFKLSVPEMLMSFFQGNRMGMLLFFGGFVAVGALGSHMAANARTLGMQYAGFTLFVALEALFFCPLLFIAANYYPGVITEAGIATVVGFSGLTAVAFVSRKDFSFLGGIIKWGMICAIGLIIASFVFGFTLGLLFSVVMVAMAGAAILYETSNIIHHYPEDRYVGAGLALFAWVALMFFYMIRIFMSMRD